MKRQLRVLAGILSCLLIAGLVFFTNSDCRVKKSTWTVRGSSLSGLIEDGQAVTAQNGYYACHQPATGEIVIYAMPGRAQPLMKIIKGVPGDSFAIKKTEAGSEIFINGEAATTSQAKPYVISANRAAYLSLYEKKYGGTVPLGQVFILGNLSEGSVDSVLFGFVSVKNLLARVDH